jgi:hypothetical protein
MRRATKSSAGGTLWERPDNWFKRSTNYLKPAIELKEKDNQLSSGSIAGVTPASKWKSLR